MHILRKSFASLPIIALLAIIGASLAAAAFQADDGGGRAEREPGIDNFELDGEIDIAGYLVATAAFETSPPVPRGEPLEFRIFGCATGSAFEVTLVPRVDPLADLEAEPIENFLVDPVVLVDGTIEEDVPTVEITLPAEDTEDVGVTPLGFAIIRTTCTDAEGEDVEYDTVIDVLTRDNTFEFEEADLVTVLDGGDVEA